MDQLPTVKDTSLHMAFVNDSDININENAILGIELFKKINYA